MVDERLFAELESATETFRSALEAKSADTAPLKTSGLEEMDRSEALKQRIERIKEDL